MVGSFRSIAVGNADSVTISPRIAKSADNAMFASCACVSSCLDLKPINVLDVASDYVKDNLGADRTSNLLELVFQPSNGAGSS